VSHAIAPRRHRWLPYQRWRTEVRRYDCKFKGNVNNARLKSRRPLQIQLQLQKSRRAAGATKVKTPSLPSLLFLLVDVFGLFVEVRGVVFEQALLQFFFGDARGFARPGVIHHGAAADQQLPSAARDHYDVGKLAIWCILEMSHVKISLQKTSGFREFVLQSLMMAKS
jgi:hypothetical protein